MRTAFFVCLVLFPVHAATAQERPPVSSASVVLPAVQFDGRRSETPHLTLTATARPHSARPGERLSLVVEIVPKPGMHVYAPGQKELIPISLSLEPDVSYKAHPAKFPEPEKYFFEPLGETQLVYSQPFEIARDVTLATASGMRKRASTDSAAVTISGTLRYQACDEKVCYMPQTLPVSWTVRLKP